MTNVSLLQLQLLPVGGNITTLPTRRSSACCSYETSAAIIETETSTAELAQEVHNRATQARIAAKEAALFAEVRLTRFLPYMYMAETPGLTLLYHMLLYFVTGSAALTEQACPSRRHH
jgi:hypothetical protein